MYSWPVDSLKQENLENINACTFVENRQNDQLKQLTMANIILNIIIKNFVDKTLIKFFYVGRWISGKYIIYQLSD